jgi:hypothetical protein
MSTQMPAGYDDWRTAAPENLQSDARRDLEAALAPLREAGIAVTVPDDLTAADIAGGALLDDDAHLPLEIYADRPVVKDAAEGLCDALVTLADKSPVERAAILRLLARATRKIASAIEADSVEVLEAHGALLRALQSLRVARGVAAG